MGIKGLKDKVFVPDFEIFVAFGVTLMYGEAADRHFSLMDQFYYLHGHRTVDP